MQRLAAAGKIDKHPRRFGTPEELDLHPPTGWYRNMERATGAQLLHNSQAELASNAESVGTTSCGLISEEMHGLWQKRNAL